MRTKDEMVAILSRRLLSKEMDDSTWADLVDAVQNVSQLDRQTLVKYIAKARYQEVGKFLHAELLKNAEERAKAEVDTMLVDDTLTLAELDTLI